MTTNNSHVHSPAQTAKLKHDIDCLERHIQTLEQSLDFSRKKYDSKKANMIAHCQHDYVNTGKDWTPPSDKIQIEMWQVECKKCGNITWKIKKEDE